MVCVDLSEGEVLGLSLHRQRQKQTRFEQTLAKPRGGVEEERLSGWVDGWMEGWKDGRRRERRGDTEVPERGREREERASANERSQPHAIRLRGLSGTR